MATSSFVLQKHSTLDSPPGRGAASCASTASLSSVAYLSSDDLPPLGGAASSFADQRDSGLRDYLYPKFATTDLPSQADSAKWLKYLLYIPLLSAIVVLVTTEFWMRVAVAYGLVEMVENLAHALWEDVFIFRLMLAGTIIGMLTSFVATDLYTMIMLCYGKRRRHLPGTRRLMHAVVVCQYKEPLEVLDATIASIAENTLAHNTIIVVACEARDAYAESVFETLRDRYSLPFHEFLKTTHQLTEGEVIGKSSNENHAVRELFKYVQDQGVDPFQVMVTVCDADSLFDPVFLEHVEAEFWSMPDGRRAIFNAPISTHRNLVECDLLVQAMEMSRCQYDTFLSPTTFRPSQSNYSLTLGFCHETGYWDPTNTAEDFHTAIKAMAISGQGKPIVVKVWSLILNDSVCRVKDRWTQAQRHMWGIEECAWVLELFFHLRLNRWLPLVGMTFGQMILGTNCIPGSLILLLPTVRQVMFSLRPSSQIFLVAVMLITQLAKWVQFVVREVALRRYILADRKHMMNAGWKNWLLIATPFWLVVEQLSLVVFVTFATWSMLIHALSHETILYVTAPKAFSTNETTDAMKVPLLPIATGKVVDDNVRKSV